MGRDDYYDRERRERDGSRDGSRDRHGRGGARYDRGRDWDRGKGDRGRGRDRSRSRSPKRSRAGSRDHHRPRHRVDHRRDDDRDRGGSPKRRDDAPAPAPAAKRAEVRAPRPPPAPFPRRMGTRPARDATNVDNPNPSLPTPTQPLSLEELLRKRKADAEASAKPTFISKKDREAAALRRREEEVAAQRSRAAGAAAGGGGREWARERRREEERARDDERRRRERERDREKELERIRNQYMGGEPERKKPSRPADKFKFKFDWDKDQDTSQDLNPLYENPHEGALLFGRGLRAGIDRRAQMRDNSHAQMALIAKSREDAGRAMSREELRRAEARADADDAQRERDERQTTRAHWSEKSLEDMNERDWRIFREDHSITTRGGKLPRPMRSWAEATMPVEIVRAIEAAGYAKPSPIQMASIPIGLLKRDVIGIAETGSGKTCAFVVPMLAYIMDLPAMTDEVATKGPYALVMAPTRELAQQIEEETSKFARYLNYRVTSVVGGQDIEAQGFTLRRGCEIVIGTPGRIIDVLERRYTVLQQCNYIVLDEADRMIDMGFEPQVNSVMDSMSAESLKPEDQAEEIDGAGLEAGAQGTRYRMTYMFSATMPPSVERLARKYLRNPAVVNIGSAGKTSDLIKQVVVWTTKNEKETQLELTLSRFPDTQAIVFANTKRSVDAVCSLCQKFGYSVGTIHGSKSQDQREEALRGFKAGQYDILVATDVAGRGIDVKNIDLVVNYELPHVIENYTHRIGRTGRGGRRGTAVAFLTGEDTDIMYDLKELLKNSGNVVPPELDRHEASKVKPMRDAKGGRMTREELRGLEEIIH